MKLLHVAATYLPARRYGGTIVSVHGLCRALAARGHEVHVFTTSVDGDDDSPVDHGVPVNIDGVSVTYFRSAMLRRLFYAPALSKALRARASGFDVIHTHAIYLWPLWAAAHEARRTGVPYVMSLRGMLEKELIQQKSALQKAALIAFIEKRNIESAAAVHVTSAREADEARAFGFDVKRYAEIANGVDFETDGNHGVAVSPSIAAIVAAGPFALFLGRINWKKGLDRLIAALPHAPNVRVVLAGNDEERYQPSLEALALRTGVRERIIFAGAVQGADKAALLAAARLLVLPSYSENFGNVVLEAMAAGTPVLVTEEVGAAEIVRRSGAGVVCGGNASDLGGSLAALMNDASPRQRMASAGKAEAARYAWPHIAGQMEELYQSIRCAR